MWQEANKTSEIVVTRWWSYSLLCGWYLGRESGSRLGSQSLCSEYGRDNIPVRGHPLAIERQWWVDHIRAVGCKLGELVTSSLGKQALFC